MSIKLLKKIHGLVRAVTDEEFFIAGGAARDTLYGVEPKDYDCVVCLPEYDEVSAFYLLDSLSEKFSWMGAATKVYQSYGLNLGEEVNPTSFQAMFWGCMKVSLKHCELDILISKASTISEHVKRHDCNMNMVWFDGGEIKWEHGGNEAKVDRLEFRSGICDERIDRMVRKWFTLNQDDLLSPL